MASVYWLLFVLVFATADLKPAKRLLALIIAGLAVFVLNLGRMLFLASIVHTRYFDTAHWLFENFFSIFLLVLVWLLTARLLKIRTVPFYTDLRFLRGYFKSRIKKN